MATQGYEVYRPDAHPRPEPPARAEHRHRPTFGCCGSADVRQRWLTISAICVAIWLMTGAGYFWPMWVMLGLGVPVLLGRR